MQLHPPEGERVEEYLVSSVSVLDTFGGRGGKKRDLSAGRTNKLLAALKDKRTRHSEMKKHTKKPW